MDENSGSQGEPENKAIPGAVISPGATVQPEQIQQANLGNTAVIMQQVDQNTDTNNQSTQVVDQSGIPLARNDDGLSWTGPEFISHDKPSQWYLSCLVIALILGAATYFATGRDLLSSLTITLAIVVLGFYSLRKPKNITYSLSDKGISIGTKNFLYEELRAFIATIEGDYLSITILPLNRFGPPLGLCYRGNGEEDIVNFLSDRLPIEKHKPDMLERLLLRLRF